MRLDAKTQAFCLPVEDRHKPLISPKKTETVLGRLLPELENVIDRISGGIKVLLSSSISDNPTDHPQTLSHEQLPRECTIDETSSSDRKDEKKINYASDIKEKWRDTVDRFIAERIPASERPQKLVLDMPGEDCYSTAHLVKLGFMPHHIYGVENGAQAQINRFLENAKRYRINPVIGDLDDVLPGMKEEFDIAILDFTGQLCEKYLRILSYLPLKPDALVLINVMAKREQLKAKTSLFYAFRSLSRIRPTIRRELEKFSQSIVVGKEQVPRIMQFDIENAARQAGMKPDPSFMDKLRTGINDVKEYARRLIQKGRIIYRVYKTGQGFSEDDITPEMLKQSRDQATSQVTFLNLGLQRRENWLFGHRLSKLPLINYGEKERDMFRKVFPEFMDIYIAVSEKSNRICKEISRAFSGHVPDTDKIEHVGGFLHHFFLYTLFDLPEIYEVKSYAYLSKMGKTSSPFFSEFARTKRLSKNTPDMRAACNFLLTIIEHFEAETLRDIRNEIPFTFEFQRKLMGQKSIISTGIPLWKKDLLRCRKDGKVIASIPVKTLLAAQDDYQRAMAYSKEMEGVLFGNSLNPQREIIQ